MKDTIYFRHDFDSYNDPKLVKVRMKYKWEWYGLFWALLEIMRADADVVLKLSELDAYAYHLQYDIAKLKVFLEYLCDVWLLVFDKKDDVFYSVRLQEDVEFMREKSAKASKAARTRRQGRGKKDANALQTQSDGNAIKDIKEKKRKDSIIKKEKKDVSKETQPKVVYGKEEINFVIETIKKACATNNLLYSGKGDIERRACTRLLSKSFSNKISKFGMTLEQLIFTVVEVSKKLKYNNTFATSAKNIYYHWEDIINKWMHQAENQALARPSGKPTGTFKV